MKTEDKCPWTEGLQKGFIGVKLSLHTKIVKHLENNNHSKIADYLQMIKRALPNKKLAEVIDPTLATRSIELLKRNGYVNKICEDGKFRIWKP